MKTVIDVWVFYTSIPSEWFLESRSEYAIEMGEKLICMSLYPIIY